jgi:hypothetical protein
MALSAFAVRASIGEPLWMVALCPGYAFVPALYYLWRRRRTEQPAKARDFTGRASLLTLMGVAIVGYSAYALVRMW